MKVDMTPQAVGQRLRTMNELWLLSAKLMNSKRVKGNGKASRKRRALEVQDSIRQVLFYDWDPIGVSDQPNLVDEYDPYIGPVYRMLTENPSEYAIAHLLNQIERNDIGVEPASTESLIPIARKLLRLDLGSENRKVKL